MSQVISLGSGGGGGGSNVQTLTGNIGGPVPPTGNNINIIGMGDVTVAGNAGTSTLIISLPGPVATEFDADSGSATPLGGVLNIVGGLNITTTGAGNTITVSETQAVLVNNYSVANAALYVVAANDYYITVDTTTIPIMIQLPDAPTLYQIFIIKDSGGMASLHNVTVTTVSGILHIDAAATFVMNNDYEAISVLYDGFGYQIF